MRRKYIRKDRLLKQRRPDAYYQREKWSTPTLCKSCQALFVDGRWTWLEYSDDVTNKKLCPACKRIQENYPAGIVDLRGPFIDQHRQEIKNLIHNTEESEKAEHPLERIMSIDESATGIHLTTTGVHIARRIGAALSRAYSGDLAIQYVDGDRRIWVSWER